MKKRLWVLLLLLALLVPPGCRVVEREDIYFVSLPRAYIDWDYEYREVRYSPVVYHYTGGGELTVSRMEARDCLLLPGSAETAVFSR